MGKYLKRFHTQEQWKEYKKQYDKEYRLKNLEKRREQQREWGLCPENKAHKKAYDKKYRSLNKEKINQRTKKKLEECPQTKLRKNLRNRLIQALKRGAKKGSAVKDLGCSIVYFKEYLEKQFQPGMTWENWSRGGWHIDHIQPLSSFDLENREQFLKAVHYTNLRPMWGIENIKKGNRVLL